MTASVDPRPGHSRRRFLAGTGAAVVGAAVLGSDVLDRPDPLDALAHGDGPRLPVAYVEGSAGADGPLPAGARAVPAASARGDRSALAGVPLLVGLRGTTPGALTTAGVLASGFLVDALLRSPDQARTDEVVPFYAWTQRPGGQPTTTASTFVVGAHRGSRVAFTLTAPGMAGEPAVAVLTSGGGGGATVPVLAGTYLLGLRSDLWSSPSALPAIDHPAWAELPSLIVTVAPTDDPDRLTTT